MNMIRLERTAVDGVPDRFVRYTYYNLCDQITQSNVKYKVTTYATGAPEAVEYHDMLDRVLLSRTQALNGQLAYMNTIFDSLGRREFESIPSSSTSETLSTRYL